MRRLVLCALVLACVAGCGPVQSTSLLIDADVALQAARTAGADKTAPYEFASAEAYLHKAREEAGYSDFHAAVTFARKARDFAREAKDKALATSNKPAEGP